MQQAEVNKNEIVQIFSADQVGTLSPARTMKFMSAETAPVAADFDTGGIYIKADLLYKWEGEGTLNLYAYNNSGSDTIVYRDGA